MEILSAVPTFLVSDVAETCRWYEKHLGFVTAGKFPPSPPHVYASLQRERAEIMLLNLAGYQKPDLSAQRPSGLWDAYIRMRGVNNFYETLRDNDFIKMPLTHQSYGDWEFEVRDPNGYILVFGGEY
ncbi:MAG TPA: VOC family protein [Pyrinomonadaceae bacterium]|nr:VOC family protein [Pyrinomonadaceae bacterium]